ncbi:MAG: acylphosphatase [Methanosarcinales archaeon]|nr:MAG: acylphosphatase [ANME-2 cluster archaeon]MCD4842370.1 acylphosphatase [Methanosarcinales archaeon]NOR60395.1 acylphosphatase [Methanosarcinales archaeon]
MNDIRVHLIVSGRVQGVFFRHNTMKKAVELGLKGWVMNLPDGNVEAVFEGIPQRVHEMIRWCHMGPTFADVKNVQEEWEEPTGEFSSFDLRYK